MEQTNQEYMDLSQESNESSMPKVNLGIQEIVLPVLDLDMGSLNLNL